jgi:hypothetical protein
MATDSTAIISFGNTPQAKDDLLTPTGLTEDSLRTVILDVMGNDLGVAAKRLWSLDNGNKIWLGRRTSAQMAPQSRLPGMERSHTTQAR